MTFRGTIRNGVVVLDRAADLPEGMEVRVEPVSDVDRALDRLADGGLLTRASAPRRRVLPPPVKAPGKPLSKIVIEDRG